MDLLTVDLETHYSKTYSLKKLTTEEYIRDDQFEVIGVAVKVNDGDTQWFSGTFEETKAWLQQFDWANSMMLAHNCAFDAAILHWRFGIKAKAYADTMSMGNALGDGAGSVSLDALSKKYELGEKGTEVVNALGKRRLDFTPEELARYGEYCVNDVNLCYLLFTLMRAKGFPMPELKLIDLTLRMFVEPVFELDTLLLEQHLESVLAKKAKLLQALEGVERTTLMSNPQFADLLRSRNVEPPMKMSPTTGKETYAFAKTDEAFRELLGHEDVYVQALVAARLGTKSTIEETRTQRMIDISKRGRLPVPIKYCGARTKRWSGEGGGINMQNLPRTSPIKQAIRAPAGHVIVGVDLSNIELRVGLWFGGMKDKLGQLRDGLDLYKDFASLVFEVPYDEVDKDMRFIGKTCIAEGTLVLSESGWKPIERITHSDRLWDGEEWACHQGLVFNGLKETLPICGAWLTPDHQVWSGTSWQEAISLTKDENILHQSLATAAANLPLQAIYKVPEAGLKPSSFDVIVARTSTPSTPTTSKTLRALDASVAHERRERRNDTGRTSKLSLMMTTAGGYLTGWPQRLIDAITPTIRRITITGGGGLQSLTSGVQTRLSFCGMYSSYPVGTTQYSTWIESTTTKGTTPVTYASYRGRITPTTDANCTSWRRKLRVYDIASVGTRNRFTILTDAGPLIVHNCQLALIYGTGSAKLRASIKTGSRKDIGDDEAKRIVTLYRSQYSGVVAAWEQGEKALKAIRDNQHMQFGPIEVDGGDGLLLPSGLYMQYPLLRRTNEGWEYKVRNGWEHIYGAKVYQGSIQALARCVMGDGMLRFHKRYPQIAKPLTIHDALYVVAPEDMAKQVESDLIADLCVPPSWAPDLPLAAEGGFGKTLFDC